VRWLARLTALMAMLTCVLGARTAPAGASNTPATPVVVSASTASANSAGALTIVAPSGVRRGDLLLASIALSGAGPSSVTAPTGWTEVPGAEAQITATGVSTETFYSFAGRSSPGAYTFASVGGAGEDWDGVITGFAGADDVSPVEIAVAQVNATPSRTVAAPSITPTAAASTLVFVGVGPPATAWTPPPGMTEQATVSDSGEDAIGETVASEPGQPATATGSVSAVSAGGGGGAASAGVLIALASDSAKTPAPLSTTKATNISSGNATLGTTTLPRCTNGCQVWTRWRPASSSGPWTTGASAGRSGPNGFEAYNLAASTKYEYEVCDNLSGTVCYGAHATADTGSAGTSPSFSTFTTLSCAAAQGHYGQSLTTASVNFGAMPSYTCPPFADGKPTAWSEQAPRSGGAPDPPVLSDSATMVKDVLATGLDNISVGKLSTGWPVYYSSASDPVYKIVCSGTCPSANTVHVPPGVQAEDDVDHHLSVIDQSSKPPVEFDMWGVSSISAAPCNPCVIHAINAGSDAVNGSSQESGSGGVGADAAHDSLQAGALRAEELFGEGFDGAAPQGLSVRHALAISVPCTADHVDGNEIYPATGNDGTVCSKGTADAPEMGQRFVLTAPVAQIDGASEPQWKKNLLLALDYYGAIVVDTNGPGNGTSIRYQNDLSYGLPNAANSVWGDPWMSFAAANDDGNNITGYSSTPGGPDTVYSLNLAPDAWLQNELRRYLVAVKSCVSLGDCPKSQ
jgi:hypothetical protein